MAPRTALLLVVLLGALLCLHSVASQQAATTVAGAGGVDVGSEADASGFDMAEVDDETEVDMAESDAEGDDDQTLPARPLARILHERSLKRCWSKKHCRKHFKMPGCCKKKCVNLASDNKNCGQCGKCCNTTKGYCCRSGKCRKPHRPHHPHKPHHPAMCGHHKKCKKGYTCCMGKCVHLKSNRGHCGRCGKGCGYGSACCKGECVNLKHDSRNCGKCGRSCGYGRKCCNGCCKNVFGSDKHNCGACGKKCASKCAFGMCGYGH